MVSTYTPNIQLEEPARGDQVGTWDTPVNNNMTLLDLVTAGAVTIALNNAPVVLAAAQFQAERITFNSTLTGNVTITFPTSFTKAYTIVNACTGSSAFTITLQTSNAGGNYICAMPINPFQVFNDGSSLRFKNLAPVGSYMDYAGSSMPNWISGCAIPPYLDCNGGTFSAGSYPALAVILGSTTLPDFRGRNASYLNEGTGRLTSAGAGVDGNTIFSVGGTNGIALGSSHIPSLTATNAAQNIVVTSQNVNKNIPVTAGAPTNSGNSVGNATPGGLAVPYTTAGGGDWTGVASLSGNNAITTTYTNASQQTVAAPVPLLVSGLRLIRAG